MDCGWSLLLTGYVWSCCMSLITAPCSCAGRGHSVCASRSLTCGFICCQDAFSSSYNPLSDITELLLLLSTQEGIRMSHGDCDGDKTRKTQRERERNIDLFLCHRNSGRLHSLTQSNHTMAAPEKETWRKTLELRMFTCPQLCQESWQEHSNTHTHAHIHIFIFLFHQIHTLNK